MTDKQLETLYERASIASSAPSIPSKTRERIDDLWDEVHEGVDVTNAAAFGPFLAKFIRDRHSETPPEQRTERLCRTGNYLCNTLHGKVPAELRTSRSRFGQRKLTVADGRSYVAENNQCIVVADAVEAWEDEVAETKRLLQRIIKISREHSSGPEMDPRNVPGAEEQA